MSSKVQVNIDSELKHSAEDIIKEIGLTPTAVINGMYKEMLHRPIKQYRFTPFVTFR